jgi:hypothetical protein
MSMTRNKIQESINEAQRFIKAAEEALGRLDLECDWRDERYDDLAARGIDGPRPAPGRSFDDYSYGSKETGALRRASLDLTRRLAELRK